MAADAAVETSAAWPVAATASNSSMRQIAITLMRPFADLGHTGAMFNLGVLLAGSNPSQARMRYEQAADLGHTDAMTNLGVLLEDSDREEAIGWCTKAAAGRPIAMNNLAELLIRKGDLSAAGRWADSLATCLSPEEEIEEPIAEQLRTSLTEIGRMSGRPSAEIAQQQPEGSPSVADRRTTTRTAGSEVHRWAPARRTLTTTRQVMGRAREGASRKTAR